MNTEFEAVIEVRKILNRTNYLEAYIDENDKTPIWDGFILVYADEKFPHPKRSLKGRVSVQVKGRKKENLPDKVLKFPVSLDDLKGFKSEGGAIFFVVFINDNYDSKIYYSDLLNIDIERLMVKHGEQKEVSINFQPFPSDKGTIMSIFLSFIANRNRQTGTVNKEKLFLDKWNNPEDQQKITKYTMPITLFNDPNKSVFELATSIPQYLYISPKDFDHILVPVDRLEKIAIGYDQDGEISINKKSYYDNYKIVWEEGDFTFHFGKGLSMSFKKVQDNTKHQGYKINMNLEVKGTLKERIKDVEFFINYFENKNVTINSVDFPLSETKVNNQNEVDSFKYLYKILSDLQIKLNTLGITEDLDIDTLKRSKHDEEWKLDFLLQIGEESKEFTEDENKSNIRILEIVNIRILLFVNYHDGKKSFSDYYTPCFEVIAKDAKGHTEDVLMSQYTILKKDNLTVSNFKHQVVYEDIIKYEPNEYYLHQINLFLLEVLKAYDSYEGNQNDLYQLYMKLSEWLISHDDDILFFMNHLQILKRKTKLSKENQTTLNEKLNIYKDDWEIYIGLLILLDENKEALEILSEQGSENKTKFKNYPIFNLLEKS